MRNVHTPNVNEARKKHQRPFVNSFIIHPIEFVIIFTVQIYWYAVQSIFTECSIFDYYFFFLLFLVDIVQHLSS